MAISDTWTQHTPVALESNFRLGSTRLLVGIPCLAIGAYWLYSYLVMGIIAYVRAGDWAGLARDSGGWVVIMFIGLIFLLPSWIALVYRRQVRVDTERGELVVVQDSRPYKRLTHHRLDKFNRVVVIWQPIKDTRRKSYDVTLLRADETSVLVASMTNEEEAEQLGNAMARMLGVPLLSVSHSEWRDETRRSRVSWPRLHPYLSEHMDTTVGLG